MALRKITNNPAAPVALNDNQTKLKLPTLWEHLTQRTYDDETKTPRKTSTITLFLRPDGALGAVLNDKDNARSCFAAATSLKDLLDALEAAASSEDTEWRADREVTGTSRRIKNR